MGNQRKAESDRRVLVVDDEKNIRVTLTQALEPLDVVAETAASGWEAFDKLEETAFWLVLLDIRMPGLDGMEVLRRLRKRYPEVRVIMITAHGTVTDAVEAMKLGVVDFIQKPFSLQQIRSLVRRVLARETLDPEQAEDHGALLELARRGITQRQFDTAAEYVRQALARHAQDADAYNLQGVLFEVRGERFAAQQSYRRALALDPAHQAARANLRRSVDKDPAGSFMLEEVKKADLLNEERFSPSPEGDAS